ncbi:MAG: cytochrome o ubiquinol oxidase subunit IV [Verrucomicrobia bacterium]|nr:cytochrome o ubiquinol oxidase subunit IV [Verrucomicrobiota bacterium]
MNHAAHGTFKSYLIGLILCVLLTLASFGVVSKELLTGKALLFTIFGLALVQMAIQLVIFLHLGDESKPKWNFHTFLFMFTILVIIVLGSLWIMFSLEYRDMVPM